MKALLVICMTLLAASAQAGLRMDPNGASQADVEEARTVLAPALRLMDGVVGHGMTACDTFAGMPFTRMTEHQKNLYLFENCLSIMTGTEEATKALRELLPEGVRPRGLKTYITVEMVGTPVAQ